MIYYKFNINDDPLDNRKQGLLISNTENATLLDKSKLQLRKGTL